ncbi:(2Fe-2S)-binding protein [Actinomadura terrae]|uniref:(2Fe-2S)-binding protein n=1 Tax=Actinomadura terrae TaxID=604353 RepID=UPI001FA6D961|nr:(2Fe-2S)-binding protein [Actinomadura terrae]
MPAVTAAAALAEAAAFGSFFAVTVGGPGEGWRPAQDAYAQGMTDLIAARAERYGTGEPRIAASVVQLGHAARLWSPMLACAVIHGIVIDLTGLQRADDGAVLRLPDPVGLRVGEGARLAEALYRAVMDDHLRALAAGLRVKVASGLLDGNAASALVEAARALVAARPALREAVRELTTALLNTGRLVGTGHITGPELGFRRRSCCLYYRVPGGEKCHDCALARRDR